MKRGNRQGGAQSNCYFRYLIAGIAVHAGFLFKPSVRVACIWPMARPD